MGWPGRCDGILCDLTLLRDLLVDVRFAWLWVIWH